ncbi:hypothetical protein EYF80_047599 [Liparis tanakae]|uniref:Uncharacterized protein n=1 Tax=Liparis tanakae TaxID=230148 RepID=A0A4Z2FN52_9TELE|nr:hypothetical protein EYF80_047599 [Liparis tanakae]
MTCFLVLELLRAGETQRLHNQPNLLSRSRYHAEATRRVRPSAVCTPGRLTEVCSAFISLIARECERRLGIPMRTELPEKRPASVEEYYRGDSCG